MLDITLLRKDLDGVIARLETRKTTDRKFNRMRPSMARVLGLETRSAKEG